MSERQYLDLMRLIYEKGNRKGDRTGTGTRSVFGHQMRFNLMFNELPLLTTKKVFARGLIEELLWFLRGSTDNNELAAKKVSIWDGWALKEDDTFTHTLSGYDRCRLLAKKLDITTEEAVQMVARAEDEEVHGSEKLFEQEGIPKTEERVKTKAGELGPIYGKQWRAWECKDGRVIDQIAEIIELLKTNPNSRRIIVSAWNPADLPDERISPQENVKRGRMALAACHCLFQFYTRPLSQQERLNLLQHRIAADKFEYTGPTESMDEHLDQQGIPKLGLSCRLDQRSADFFLGVPFNIASYAILTAMIAQVVGMEPDELIWQGGDVHLYNNHFEQVELQLSREPLPFPKLYVSPFVKDIDSFTINDFTITGYESHDRIAAPVSV